MKIKYKKEDVANAVIKSKNWKEVCEIIGLSPISGSQAHIKKRAIFFEIDFSHFCGQSWRKGKVFQKERTPIEKYLNNEIRCSSNKLRQRLISDGYKKEECEICGLSSWQGEKIPLELDHINSKHFDNSLENLQILCPNCHAIETKKRIVKKCKKRGYPVRKGIPKLHTRKVIRPELDVILKDIDSLGYSGTGRKYGVSDNCIRRWIVLENNARELNLK